MFCTPTRYFARQERNCPRFGVAIQIGMAVYDGQLPQQKGNWDGKSWERYQHGSIVGIKKRSRAPRCESGRAADYNQLSLRRAASLEDGRHYCDRPSVIGLGPPLEYSLVAIS